MKTTIKVLVNDTNPEQGWFPTHFMVARVTALPHRVADENIGGVPVYTGAYPAKGEVITHDWTTIMSDEEVKALAKRCIQLGLQGVHEDTLDDRENLAQTLLMRTLAELHGCYAIYISYL